VAPRFWIALSKYVRNWRSSTPYMRRIFCFSRSCVPYSEMRVDLAPCWPGRESSLHLVSSERRALLRKRSVPSRLESLQLGPI
jgi:hypothetical protein